jgi:tRNA-specific 2-thiouridylase
VRKAHGADGTPEMHKGLSPQKDQSYFLFTTTPEQLAFSAFPLGDYTKEETRALATEFGLHVAEKKDSQDICFVPGGDYRKVVKKFAPEAEAPGNIVDEQGRVLGTHDGIIGFTVGQRKGLGVSAADPLYVISIRPATREVVLGPRSSLATRTFTVKDLNWLTAPNDGDEVTVKVRNAHAGNLARIALLPDGRAQV